jgi:hypothetical protein
VTAVPADRREAVAAELGPVFAALDQVLADGAGLRQAGRAEQERILTEATERARAVVARAEAGAAAHRSATAARLVAAAQAEIDQIATRADREADRIRRRGEQERPAQVARVVARVRADLLSDPDAGARP